ncbi:thioredoxin domain-containing protein [Halodesulfurarchaeum sp. HSR-GB]|uniref:DsbA family protein n=1 Tax=Halodesulfurarchaeum sp. HSR-GB TaxID=3074077 RepID=UPI00285E0D6F|nr:thioredoxin domain-containing protein [Halodesulfurarchaeum sp. HSR-GB]MDR5657135.1 thioredoxin domain-containing protein [Halodesulfurarchaeum sp. HSR-GB]
MRLTRRALLRSGSAVGLGAIAGCVSPPVPESDDSLPTPSLGSTDAPVVVQSFEDFTCGYCKQFALEIRPRIESEYVESGQVRFERYDYPFLDEEWSWKAASAARAVQAEHGSETFFDYADRLYETEEDFSVELFGTLAAAVGADPETVEKAAREEQYRSRLEADRDLGDERDVSKTPTVFVNGERPESPRYRHLAPAIDRLL